MRRLIVHVNVSIEGDKDKRAKKVWMENYALSRQLQQQLAMLKSFDGQVCKQV